MQNIEKNASEGAGKKSFISSTKNINLLTAGLVIALFAALWMWKAIEIQNLKLEQDNRETFLRRQATDLLKRADFGYLKLSAKPNVWAIRTEIMKENIEAVNLRMKME